MQHIYRAMTTTRWRILAQHFKQFQNASYVPEYMESHERSLNHHYYR